MKYEIKDIKLSGIPSEDPKDSNVMIQGMNIITGIEGQKYNGFTNIDGCDFKFLKTDSHSQMIEKSKYSAIEFVNKKYPNT